MKIGTAKHSKTIIEISQRNRNLPEGWSCETVGSLYELIGGGTPSTKVKEYWNGSFPWITSADIQNLDRISPRKFITADAIDDSTTNLVPSGTVIVVTRVGLGKLALTNTEICFSQDSQGLVDKTNGKAIYNKYALYYLSLAVRDFKYKSRGTTINGVTKKQLSDLNFLLPPINEQQRIVDKIEELFSELDEGIKSLKTAQQQLKVYRQAVLKWAFEGKLTAQWREEQQGKLESAETLLAQIKAEREQRYRKALEAWQAEVEVWEANGKVGKKPRNTNRIKPELGLVGIEGKYDLPFHWQWILHGDLLVNIEAGKSFRCDERPPKHKEYGVAKVSAVTWGEYNELESKTCLDQTQVYEQFLIESGDFLFTRANTIQLVGACVIAKEVNLRIMLSDKTLRFKYFQLINPKFLLHYLRSIYGRDEIESLSTGNQESMRNIGQERIRRIRVPLPSQKEQEQIIEEIESRFSICDQLEADITTNLQKAEALRQSILKRAFEGKLVPQDPDDEPASVLLDRIRTEKAQQASAEKVSKAAAKRSAKKSPSQKSKRQTSETHQQQSFDLDLK